MRILALVGAALALALTACGSGEEDAATPPSTPATTKDKPAVAPAPAPVPEAPADGSAPPEGEPPPGPDLGEAPGPGDSPGFGSLHYAQHQVQKTQDEVAAGRHVTLSGTLAKACSGTTRMEVVPTYDGEGQAPGPVTAKETTDGSTSFSVVAPTGGDPVALAIFCDADSDGIVDPEASDFFYREMPLGKLSADQTLEVEVGFGPPPPAAEPGKPVDPPPEGEPEQ